MLNLNRNKWVNFIGIYNLDGVGDEKETYFTRIARFGNDGETTINWIDLTRVNPILEIQKALVPLGAIMMWSGAINEIPNGWLLCNGENGMPDLRGKFIVGFDDEDEDYDIIGEQGGAKKVTLTSSQMPPHNHNGSVTIPPHSHPLGATAITHDGEGGDGNRLTNRDNIGSGTVTQTNNSNPQTVSLTTNNRGGGQPHENRPPYFTLAYIIYVG